MNQVSVERMMEQAQRVPALEEELAAANKQLQGIKKANDELNAAPTYANWQEKHKLSSLLGMIK